MNEPKFTAGPWEAEYVDDGYLAGHVIRMASALDKSTNWRDPRLMIHTVNYEHGINDDNDPLRGEAFANAQLIAAAPDLYAALRRVADTVCALNCPIGWKAGEEMRHCDECDQARAALARADGKTTEAV